MEHGGPSRDSDLVNGPEERTERESILIDISSDIDSQSQKGFSLVGSLIALKAPNGFHLLEIMKKSWKTQKEFEVREWRKNLFLFTFESAADREWVLKRQPWHFDNHLFAIKGLDDNLQPSDIRVDRGSFWVRAYNMPIKCMTSSIIRNIGKQIGIVEDVDEMANYAGCFARFKVNMDITIPLLRGITIFFEARQLWIPLKYESLPIFCYKCGIMSHHTRACVKETDEEDSGKHFEDIEYGLILKASPLKRLRTKKPQQALASKPNPTRHFECHAQTHPPVIPSKPRPPPLSHNLTTHAHPAPPHSNNQPTLQHSSSTPTAIPKEKNTFIPKTEQEGKDPPFNTAPFNPSTDITPITDLATLLNLKLPTKSTNNPQAKKGKTWSRYNRSPTPKTPTVHNLSANQRKCHSTEEENVASRSRNDEVEAVQKRLKGTNLNNDTSPSTALSAAIASEQSRRAQ
ncbi:uncharacterized protein LOC131015769 [Salvia miltiorrhiza]|uniref:uncharacterized protein LOC131015769 n=1 Tax=Salvia miltiorrhiza TaxID=226208 RepID=UPI0025ABCFF5|nr:uncharacterized protein LOC131015769 [Salvia miltiorrhiza]